MSRKRTRRNGDQYREQAGLIAAATRCPVDGKVRYGSKADAKKAIRRWHGGYRSDSHLSPYRCGEFWHVGNLPRQVVAGEVSRDELPNRIRRGESA